MNPENNTASEIRESVYQKLLHRFILAAAFLLPTFFLSSTLMNLYSAKIAVFATLAILSLVVLLSELLVHGRLSFPKEKLLWPFILLPIVATVSAVFSGGFFKSFIGTVFEVNSASFWALGVLFAITVMLSVKRASTLEKSIQAFIYGACVALLVIVLKILASYGILPASLVSSLPDYLGIGSIDTLLVLGAAMLLSVNKFLFGQNHSKSQKVIMAVLVLGSILFAGAVGFKTYIILVALFALVHFIYTISLSKIPQASLGEGEQAVHPSVLSQSSLVSLAVLTLSLILILGGNDFSGFLSKTLRVSNVDIRPNFTTTVSLVGNAWQTDPIIGVGPNRFSNLWNTDKPLSINGSQFWNVDFNNGFSYLLTMMAEVGILGSLALIIFLVLFLMAGVRVIFNQNLDPRRRFIVMSLFLVSLYFWLMAFIYTVGVVVLSLTFLFTGLFIATFNVFELGSKKEVNLFGNPKTNFISIFILVVCLLFSISGAYFVWEKLVASAIFNKGERVLQTGDLPKAGELLVRASLMTKSDAYWRGVANTYSAILQNRVASLNPNAQIDANLRNELQTYIGNSIAAAESAIAIDNKNYLNYFVLGNVYEILARIGVEGSVANAKANYSEARKLSPQNPGIPLMLSRISVLEGNTEEAFQNIDAALALKSNFADAYYLKSQIEVAGNNISGAIKSVENATLIDPNNVGLYFQLGLLNYNQRDWRGAAAAFERAVTLVPDYANAKYFLGLVYSMLDRNQDAVKQFEELAASNSDNVEVKFILNNLKAGRDPFANAKPPVDDKPEKRDELPLEE